MALDITVVDSFLDAKPAPALDLEVPEGKLTPQEFEELQREMDDLRKRIQEGHQATEEEMRKIVVYFIARRGRLFKLEKPKKEAAPKAAKAAKKKAPAKKASVDKGMDAKLLLDSLGL
jgi:hypothetical protein